MTRDWWERACFELGWRQHGGNGLGRTYSELLSMDLGHIQRDLKRMNERRQEELDQLKKARSGK